MKQMAQGTGVEHKGTSEGNTHKQISATLCHTLLIKLVPLIHLSQLRWVGGWVAIANYRAELVERNRQCDDILVIFCSLTL